VNRDNIKVKRIAYPNQSFDSALTAPAEKQLLISSIAAINGSVANMAIGLGYSSTRAGWQIEVTLGGVPVDETANIQAGVPTIILGQTIGDQSLIRSKDLFGLLSFNVSQIETGAPAYAYEYWDGSAFVALPLINIPFYTAVGQQNLVFAPPVDWARDAEDLYAIRVRVTTAPTQDVMIDALKVCELLAYREFVPPKGELLLRFEEPKQLLLQQGEEIIPFFAFSSTSNTMETSYQINP